MMKGKFSKSTEQWLGECSLQDKSRKPFPLWERKGGGKIFLARRKEKGKKNEYERTVI